MKVKYSKELLQNAVNKSYSIADVCRQLGLKPVGGNYNTITKQCKKFNIDISHFIGQAWKNSPIKDPNVYKLDDLLQQEVNFKSSYLKKRLIQAGLKEDKCEICGCENIWCNKPITLELHHKNSDHFDNRLSNLQVLCPNCHSQQKNHRKPKTQHRLNEFTVLRKHLEELKTCICMNCGKEFKADRINKTRKFCCIKCYREYVAQFGHKDIQETHNNYFSFSLEEFREEMQNCNTITELARRLNSHRCTVREYLVRNGLYDEFAKKNKYIKKET